MILALSAAAFAEESTVPHGFQVRADLPMWVRAGHAEARGSTKGDDCAGAVQAALADLSHGGAVLAVDGDGTVVCKQRKAGDAVSASLVELSGWWVTPGTGPAVDPTRQLALAKVLAGLMPDGAPLALEPGPAGAWLTWPTVAPTEALPVFAEPSDRAAHAFGAWVSEWIPTWAPLLGALPELAGARMVIAWPADKAKNGALRFDVPKEITGPWLAGDVGDDVLVQGMQVAWSPDPRKTPFAPLQVDVEAGAPRAAPAPVPESRPIDVKPEDMEGLEDEAP